jgi:hypothetical protein
MTSITTSGWSCSPTAEAGGVQARKEVGGVAATPFSSNIRVPGPDGVDLHLTVDTATAVQPSYAARRPEQG